MTRNSTALISLNDLQIQTNANIPLSALSFDVWKENRFAILGLPGSGKTVLVRALAGLIKTESGNGFILDYTLDDPKLLHATSVGFLHQSINWSGTLTVENILHLTLVHYHLDKYQGLDELIKTAGMNHKKHVTVQDLSIKERQLLGLLALSIQNPKILVVDNPADNLKDQDRIEILDFLAYISKDKTVLFTTSHLSDVKYFASHVAILHEGLIFAKGEKDLILTDPETSIYRVALTGNTKIVYEHIKNLAWIKNITVESRGEQTIWRIAIEEHDNISTRLLRVILADQSLSVLQFNQIRPRIDTFLNDLETVNKI